MALAKCYIAKSILALILPDLFVAFDTITSAFLLGGTSNLWASREFPWSEFPLTSVCLTGSHCSAHESSIPQAPTFLDVPQTPQFQHFSVLNPELLTYIPSQFLATPPPRLPNQNPESALHHPVT